MLNIQTQSCALLLLLIITYFYSGLRRIDVKTQRAFWHMIIMAIICVSADILSVFAIFYRANLPKFILNLSCKFYLVTLVGLCLCGFVYICSDFYPNNKQYIRATAPYKTACALISIAIAVTHIEVVCENEGEIVYSQGTSTMVTYVCCFLLFLAMMVHLGIGWRRLNPRRKNAAIIWIVVWVSAALIQFFNARLLIVSFAGSVGVIMIYMMIENPEANIEKTTGLFNIGAMYQYINEYLANDVKFSLLCTDYRQDVVKLSRRISNGTAFVGGGEFFMLFSGKSADSDVAVAARILQLEEHEDIIYVFPETNIYKDYSDILNALRLAQKLPAKELRNQVFYLDNDFKRQINERLTTEKLIKDAIANDRVVVYYQPLYSIKDNDFHSAEALVRIIDEKGNLISPALFIPVAEDNGLILELGKIIFDKVCVFLSKYDYESLGLQYIESNLSVIQGEDERLVDDIINTMKKHNTPASAVRLEITETASIRGKNQLLGSMNRLIENGIEFALDDFGTGQSNLDYMADMPVKMVKFDKNMTQGYFTTDKIKCIMHAAINMIHDMGMQIVVEGIENELQYDSMVSEGVEYIQGYYFSKPLPEDKFIEFLKEKNIRK